MNRLAICVRKLFFRVAPRGRLFAVPLLQFLGLNLILSAPFIRSADEATGRIMHRQDGRAAPEWRDREISPSESIQQ